MSLGEGNGTPLQYSCLENPMDGGAWWAAVHGVAEDTTRRLHFHFSLSCIGEGNGNPLQCSCLENPRDGGAWRAAIYGVTRSQTWLKWLSSSSSRVCVHIYTYMFNTGIYCALYMCVYIYILYCVRNIMLKMCTGYIFHSRNNKFNYCKHWRNSIVFEWGRWEIINKSLFW